MMHCEISTQKMVSQERGTSRNPNTLAAPYTSNFCNSFSPRPPRFTKAPGRSVWPKLISKWKATSWCTYTIAKNLFASHHYEVKSTARSKMTYIDLTTQDHSWEKLNQRIRWHWSTTEAGEGEQLRAKLSIKWPVIGAAWSLWKMLWYWKGNKLAHTNDRREKRNAELCTAAAEVPKSLTRLALGLLHTCSRCNLFALSPAGLLTSRWVINTGHALLQGKKKHKEVGQ